MKILLLGGNGQVGRELRRSLAPLGQVLVATRDGRDADLALDFADIDGLQQRVAALPCDVVVNAAAYTAVDRAESEPDRAFLANALAPAALAQACAARGARLLHYSTDYVFDGRSGHAWREDDATGPLGVYGESKLAGEQAIAAAGARHLILRTAWVYATHGHNFLRSMLRLAGERDVLAVVDDQVGSPTPAAWIADATARILRAGGDASGTWHLTTQGQVSWHGFAEAIFAEAQSLGLIARRPRVDAIASRDYPTSARRPAWSVLDTGKLTRDFGITPPDWRAALQGTMAALAVS